METYEDRRMCAVITWDGGAGPIGPNTYSWHAAANWSGDVVPGPADDVVINTTGGITISISQAASVRSLESNKSLSVSGSADVTISSGLTMAVNTGLTVTGSSGRFTANGTTHINGVSLIAAEGAQISLPDAVEYRNTRTNDADLILRATGSGSIVSLPNVLTVAGATNVYDDLWIEALGGGQINLGKTSQIPNSAVFIKADGSGSRVDLGQLVSFDGYFSNTNSGFQALEGGSLVTPLLTKITDANLTFNGTGTMHTGQIAEILGLGTLSISGQPIDLRSLKLLQFGNTEVIGVNQPVPALIDITGRSLIVTAGGRLEIAGVTSYLNNHTDDSDRILRASGNNSLLSLPNVVSLTGATNVYDDLWIEALEGGHINLGKTVQIPMGAVQVKAHGTGSRVDLSQLQSFVGYFSNTSSGFIPQSGGTIHTPLLEEIRNADLTFDGTGTMPVSSVRKIEGAGTLRISGRPVGLDELQLMSDGNTEIIGVNQPFPSLLVIDGRSLIVSQGAQVHVDGVQTYVNNHNDDVDRVLRATGAGSILSLPNVVSVTGATNVYDDLWIEALAGGQIKLDKTNHIPNSAVFVKADGIDSHVDLSQLTSFDGYFSNTNSGFQALKGGSIATPQLKRITDANLTFDGTGTMHTGQIEEIDGLGTLSISGQPIDLSSLKVLQYGNTEIQGVNQPVPSLTDITGRAFQVSSGGRLEIAGATNYRNNHTDDSDRILRATGINSVLSLPNVVTIAGATNVYDDLWIEALAGGQVNLSNTTQMPNGAVFVKADGIDSVVNLSRLESFDGYFSNTSSGFQVLNRATLLVGSAATSTTLIDANIQLDDRSTFTTNKIVMQQATTLSGEGTITGGLHLQGDTGNGTGRAILRPEGDNAGRITVTGSYEQGSNGIVEVSVRGLAAGLQHDQLVVQGPATLNGEMKVAYGGNFVPSSGNEFDVIKYASRTGQFAQFTGLAASPSVALVPDYRGDELTLVAGTPNAPTVVSLTPPSGSVLGLSSINLVVKFSEAVLGVDATDLVLTGSATSVNTRVNPPVDLGANSWAFPVLGLSNGELLVTLAPDDRDIFDTQGNRLQPVNANYTVTLSGTNTPPVASPKTYQVRQGQSLTVPAAGVLTGATDAEGQPLIAVLTTPPTHGTLTLNPDGSFIYTPQAGYAGTDSFQFQASDSELLSAAAIVTLDVQAVVTNRAPTANADPGYTVERGQVLTVPATTGVLVNDVDPDGQPLTAVLVSGPSHGSLTLQPAGAFTYTPQATFVGTDSFTYKASDGALESGVATVTIVVNPSANNSPPTAVADNYTLSGANQLQVNAAQGLLANDSDPNGQPLTVRLIDSPLNGSVVLQSNGAFTYTPTTGFQGTDLFTYAASDGSLESGATRVKIQVSQPIDTGTTRINFEDAPAGTKVGTFYASQGVVIEGAGDFSGLVLKMGDFGHQPFGNSGLQTVHLGLRQEPTRIRFVDPQNSSRPATAEFVSLRLGDGHTDTETFHVTFLDAQGDILVGPIVTTTTVAGVTLGAQAFQGRGIASIELLLPGTSASGAAFDDLEFKLQPMSNPQTPGDLDADDDIDSSDLLAFLEYWTGTLAPGEGDRTLSTGDFDDDGDVDGADLLALLSLWPTPAAERAPDDAVLESVEFSPPPSLNVNPVAEHSVTAPPALALLPPLVDSAFLMPDEIGSNR